MTLPYFRLAPFLGWLYYTTIVPIFLSLFISYFLSFSVYFFLSFFLYSFLPSFLSFFVFVTWRHLSNMWQQFFCLFSFSILNQVWHLHRQSIYKGTRESRLRTLKHPNMFVQKDCHEKKAFQQTTTKYWTKNVNIAIT